MKVDQAEVDWRYAQMTHTHTYTPTHERTEIMYVYVYVYINTYRVDEATSRR